MHEVGLDVNWLQPNPINILYLFCPSQQASNDIKVWVTLENNTLTELSQFPSTSITLPPYFSTRVCRVTLHPFHEVDLSL